MKNNLKSSLYSSLILSDSQVKKHELEEHSDNLLQSKFKNLTTNKKHTVAFYKSSEDIHKNKNDSENAFIKTETNSNFIFKNVIKNNSFVKTDLQVKHENKENSIDDIEKNPSIPNSINKSFKKEISDTRNSTKLNYNGFHIENKVSKSYSKKLECKQSVKPTIKSKFLPVINKIKDEKNSKMSKIHLKVDKNGKNEIYSQSNLLKIAKDENNEVIIYVPCKLNMDLESLFYYFSNNSIYLNCEQFARMLHCSKLYHKSKPIDILARMFPLDHDGLPQKDKKIEYNSFLKLLHRFSQFKFRSIGASDEEKLNLVVSFLLNCDYIEIISNKLVKSERCIQVNDPTIQRKDKHVQMKMDSKDKSSQFNVNITSAGINATCEMADVGCNCEIENEENNSNIKKVNELVDQEQDKIDTEKHSNSYKFEDEEEKTPEIFSPKNQAEKFCEITKNVKKKSPKKFQEKKAFDTDLEIFSALTSINKEDDKKLYRIFVYYCGPSNNKLSYRQFYNLINDSGLLGGNFEEFLTPAQIERCYSAVIVDPKGVDYWEFKEILLYCGEVSFCGNNPNSAFQTIVKKYIIPLILTIYQPNNFEKCEDTVNNKTLPEDIYANNINHLQSMINRAILPWFRLGNQPLSSESEDYSDTCSCSSIESTETFSQSSDDSNLSTNSKKSHMSECSYSSNSLESENPSSYEFIEKINKLNSNTKNSQEPIGSEELIFMKY